MFKTLCETIWPATSVDQESAALRKEAANGLAIVGVLVLIATVLWTCKLTALLSVGRMSLSAVLGVAIDVEVFLSNHYIPHFILVTMTVAWVVLQLRALVLVATMAQKEQVTSEDVDVVSHLYYIASIARILSGTLTFVGFVAAVTLFPLKLIMGVIPDMSLTKDTVAIFAGALALRFMLLDVIVPTAICRATDLKGEAAVQELEQACQTFGMPVKEQVENTTDMLRLLAYRVALKANEVDRFAALVKTR